MIVAYSFVPVKSKQAGEEFARALATRARHVEAFPGFVRFEFRRELGKSRRYVIATWWDTKGDLRRYLSSDEHQATHERLTGEARAGLGPPQVEVHEVLEVSTQ
jgi:heme-degrading monooxygenase HmoA